MVRGVSLLTFSLSRLSFKAGLENFKSASRVRASLSLSLSPLARRAAVRVFHVRERLNTDPAGFVLFSRFLFLLLRGEKNI